MTAAVWSEIFTGVVSRCTGLAGLPTTPATRQDARLLQSDLAASLPMILIVDDGPEQPIDSTFTNIVWEQYPVLVLYVKVADRSLSLSATDLTARQLINDVLDQRPPLTGMTQAVVTDVDLAQLDPYEVAGSDSAYLAFGVKATYTAYRTRAH